MLQMLYFSPVHSTEHTHPCAKSSVLHAKVDCAGVENVALFFFYLHAPIQQTLTVLLKCHCAGQQATTGKTYNR